MRRNRLLPCALLPLLLATAWSAHGSPDPLGGALLAQAGGMGILKVDCNVEGAAVSLDGNSVGVTPLLAAVAAGEHQLEIASPGYGAHTEILSIPADKKVVVRAQLEWIAAKIMFDVRPDGATVELDGVEVGTTPDVLLDLVAPGTHRLVVSKSGYEAYSQKLALAPTQEITVTVSLQATAGLLRVTTEPAGASVWSDQALLGMTPLEKPDMPVGLHTLRLTSEGLADKFVSVDIVLGEEAEIDHVFSAEGGSLKIIPTPEDARISVDKYVLGSGRQEIEALEPGVHRVVVTSIDYLDFSEDVLVHQGRTQTVRATLDPTALAAINGNGKKPTGGNKKAPIVVAIVGAVTTGTIIAIAAASADGSEPTLPETDFTFQLP